MVPNRYDRRRMEDYKRAGPYFDCYAKKHALMGEIGAGQLTKMVNQICIAGVLQGLSKEFTSPNKRALMLMPS